MKRKSRICLIAIVVIASVVMFAGYVDAKQITKPTVGYVPPQWYLSEDLPYPTYVDDWGHESGAILYTDKVDGDRVQIFYGDVPSELKGKESDSDALIAKAIDWAGAFHKIDETGTTTIADQLGGYAKGYDPELDAYDLEIVFVKGATCVDIYACYDATSEDESQVLSLMHSISVPETQPTPTPTPTPKPQGFEAIFAIAGLLAIAYLLRRRK